MIATEKSSPPLVITGSVATAVVGFSEDFSTTDSGTTVKGCEGSYGEKKTQINCAHPK